MQYGAHNQLATIEWLVFTRSFLQTYQQQANKLAGYAVGLFFLGPRLQSSLFRQIAFLKSYATACGQETARDAVQIFGGRGITQTGMGWIIEHVRPSDFPRDVTYAVSSQYHRTIPFDALLGGAEDVLADLGVRQALRVMPKDARL